MIMAALKESEQGLHTWWKISRGGGAALCVVSGTSAPIQVMAGKCH